LGEAVGTKGVVLGTRGAIVGSALPQPASRMDRIRTRAAALARLDILLLLLSHTWQAQEE
jgi:hypothetical protein